MKKKYTKPLSKSEEDLIRFIVKILKDELFEYKQEYKSNKNISIPYKTFIQVEGFFKKRINFYEELLK